MPSLELLPLINGSKQEFLALLPPWRGLLQRLNWHPLVDLKVQAISARTTDQEARREQRQTRCNLVQLRHQHDPFAFNAGRFRDVTSLLEDYGGI